MNRVFAPGCALMIYKPELARKMLEFLNDPTHRCRSDSTSFRRTSSMHSTPDRIDTHLTCCRHEPGVKTPVEIINVCAGCDRRYRTLYEGVSTVSLWEVLAESDTFPFPDYGGQKMTVLDACPTRDQPRVHDAIRALLSRMRIEVIEPEKTRTDGTCCGDSYFGMLPDDQVKELMAERASEMPLEDVVV